MPDLQEVLSKLKPEDIEVDFDGYVEPSEFPSPPPEGIYTFRQGKPDFSASNDGKYLTAVMTQEIVAPGTSEDGAKVSFDRVSNKSFDRSGIQNAGNMMLDHLRALGDMSRPAGHDEWGKAMEVGEGQMFKGQLLWEGYCAHKGTPHEVTDPKQAYNIKGMKRFPTAPNGTYIDSVTCPTCGGEVRARARITRRIPA